MQHVVTKEQARQITGGRTPLVPVVYEEAVTALAACLSLDDARQWDNKADALAAWAKIYQDGKVERQAKALKLHAYKRMGALALELSPRQSRGKHMGTSGPGPLLQTHGLTRGQSHAAVYLARATASTFEKLLDSPRIPGPVHARTLLHLSARSPEWAFVLGTSAGGISPVASNCRNYSPEACAIGLNKQDSMLARERVGRLAEWCDAFLQAAGK